MATATMIAAPTTDTDRADGEQARDAEGAGDDATDADPMIVASPALAGNRPWAVPCRPAGARPATTVTPPTNTQANPSPSSGAISDERDRVGGQRGQAGPRAANASAPKTSQSLGPNRAAIRGKAYMSGTSMHAPNAQAMPTSPALPPSATIWIE